MVSLNPIRMKSWDSATVGSWLKNSLEDHTQVKIEGENLTYPQLVCQYVGNSLDDDEYFAFLHTHVNDSLGKLIILSGALNKEIKAEKLRAINQLFDMHRKEKGLSPNRMVAFLDGHLLLPKLKDPKLNRRIRTVMIDLLKELQATYKEGTLHHEYRRITIDLVKWLFNHVEPALEKVDFKNGLQGYLWYGSATPSEKWFLKYLTRFGFHVVIFNPCDESWPKQMLAIDDQLIYRFPKVASVLKPLPDEMPKIAGTVAFKATQEIDEIMHHDNSGLYKPFQFKSFSTNSIRLKTTVDEAFLISKERAMIRPHFEVSNKQVTIPVVFAKMMGIDRNRKHFWNHVHSLTERDDTHVIRQFPFTTVQKANQMFHYRAALGADGRLDPEKMKSANWWTYGKLPNGTQTVIGETIAKHVENPLLIPHQGETKEELQLYAFSQSMVLPEFAIRLLQVFDYPQFVPTVFIYNEEKGPELSRSDANALCMIHHLGLDIILVNPMGHQDMERWIQEGTFDLHWMDERSFEEPFKEQSVVQKIFKRFR
ncbi:YceG family protein [Paenisporosarcina indica]|uniref:YceG family protein n=1 Tax=Paenisporosarcina indica TaxID=650093 RepID=UPI00094F8E80|nr:YceG family protein [Paenisporosarcina indica]